MTALVQVDGGIACASYNWRYKSPYTASLALICRLTPVKELEYRAKNSPYNLGRADTGSLQSMWANATRVQAQDQ